MNELYYSIQYDTIVSRINTFSDTAEIMADNVPYINKYNNFQFIRPQIIQSKSSNSIGVWSQISNPKPIRPSCLNYPTPHCPPIQFQP